MKLLTNFIFRGWKISHLNILFMALKIIFALNMHKNTSALSYQLPK